jgi:hypothetical protein
MTGGWKCCGCFHWEAIQQRRRRCQQLLVAKNIHSYLFRGLWLNDRSACAWFRICMCLGLGSACVWLLTLLGESWPLGAITKGPLSKEG